MDNTIEERAKMLYPCDCEEIKLKMKAGFIVVLQRDAYKYGAIDQESITKKEMIEKACDIFSKWEYSEEFCNDFRKAMEE